MKFDKAISQLISCLLAIIILICFNHQDTFAELPAAREGPPPGTNIALNQQDLPANNYFDGTDALFSLSLDPYFSLETGADLNFCLAAGISILETYLFKPFNKRPWVGTTLRLGRTILIDHPLAIWLIVFQHEAFGHCGRAREFGVSTGFRMSSPWTCNTVFRGSPRFGAGASYDGTNLSIDEKLYVYAGGVQANSLAATLIEREVVAGRPMHSLELIYLIRSRFYTSYYVFFQTQDPEDNPADFFAEWSGGGDVAGYIGLLHTKHYGDPGITPAGATSHVITEYRRLRTQAIWNIFDPCLWISLWSIGERILNGDDPAPLSLPTIKGRKFLPILSADWLPDGGTISLEIVVGRRQGVENGPRWFSFVGRHGEGPAGLFWAFGAATEQIWQSKWFALGGEVELWVTPAHEIGGGSRLRTSMIKGIAKNIYVDIGVKSDGPWPGRPANAGVFVRAGYLFTSTF